MERYQFENEHQEYHEAQQESEKQPVKVKKPKSPKVQLVKTEIRPSGETIQLVRPLASTKESSEDIVNRLINQYGTRPLWDQSEL